MESSPFWALQDCLRELPIMKRIIIIFALAGILIPIILLITERIEVYFDTYELVPLSRLIMKYLWPSSILLGAADAPEPNPIHVAIVVMIAVLVNTILYMLVGLVVALAWRFSSK